MHVFSYLNMTLNIKVNCFNSINIKKLLSIVSFRKYRLCTKMYVMHLMGNYVYSFWGLKFCINMDLLHFTPRLLFKQIFSFLLLILRSYIKKNNANTKNLFHSNYHSHQKVRNGAILKNESSNLSGSQPRHRLARTLPSTKRILCTFYF